MVDRVLNILDSGKIKILFLFLSLAYSLNFIFWGFDFTDSFYYLTKLSEYDRYPMVSGSLFLGFLWTELFGNSLISVRLFAWICGILAIILPFVTLLPRKQWMDKIYFLVLAIVFMGPFFINGYNPDIPTLLINSLSIIFLFKYGESQQLKYIFLLGVTSAISVFLRFPNILMFPAVSAFICLFEYLFYKSGCKKSFLQKSLGILLFVTVFIIVLCIIAHIFCGSVENYFLQLKGSIKSTGENSASHTAQPMLKSIMKDFNKIIMYLGVIILFYYIFNIYNKVKNYVLKTVVLFLIYFLFFQFVSSEIIGYSYYWELKKFFSAILVFIAIVACIKNMENSSFIKLFGNLFIIALAFIGTLGSNTGLLKFSPLLLCFLPFLLSETKMNFLKNIYLIPLILMLVFFVVREYTYPFEDEKITKLTSVVSAQPKLKYIRTTPLRAHFVEDVMEEYSKIENEKNVIFFGLHSHIFYYLSEIKPLHGSLFRTSPSDNRQINKIKNQISETHPVLFLFHDYPEAYRITDQTPLEDMLIDNGYHLLQKTYFKIYFPPAAL